MSNEIKKQKFKRFGPKSTSFVVEDQLLVANGPLLSGRNRMRLVVTELLVDQSPPNLQI